LNLLEQIAYVARVSNPSNQNNHETAEKLVNYLIKEFKMSVQSTIVKTIVPHVIEFLTAGEISPDEVTRIKNFIDTLEDKAIDSAVKNQQTADLIKSLSNNLSEEVVQWVITTINLLFGQSPYVAEIKTAATVVQTLVEPAANTN
jgi:hypothetical protein